MSGSANDVHYTFEYTDAHEVESEDIDKSTYAWLPSANGTTNYAAANNLNQYPFYAPPSPVILPRTLAYDAKGNLTSGNLDGGGVFGFTYDAENRLTTACKPYVSGACSSPTVNATYLYDPLGRRVKKSGTGVAGGWFLNDGDDEIAEYDSGKSPVTAYVPGPTIDEPIAAVSGFGGSLSHKYFHVNHQGSVIAMSGDSGAKVEGPFLYDPYGNCFSGSDPCASLSNTVPYKFTGRRLDPETGLYFYRARMYWGNGGRFLQTDPVGYTVDLNLYTYVGNDPIDKTDPSGKIAPIVAGAIACAADPPCAAAAGTLLFATGMALKNAIDGDDKKADQSANGPAAANDGKTGDNNSPDPNRPQATPAPGARRGGESAAAKAGRQVHKTYAKHAERAGMRTGSNARLPSGREPDAIDDATRTVRELKPNTASGRAAGAKKIEIYRKELEQTTGQSWEGELDTYQPRPPNED